MTLLNIKRYTLLFAAICMSANAMAQDKGYKETLDMTADEKGDITVTSSIKYNAQTWDIAKQRHATDKSVLRNRIIRQFPKYKLTEFDISNDEMETTSKIKFKILGSLKADANGKWVAELDSKNPNITKISDNQFLLVDEGSAQTSKIILPSSATGAKIETDTFGKAILTYTAPVSGGGIGNIIKYLGFLVAAGGIFLFFKNRGSLNTIFVKDSNPKKIKYPETKHIDDAVVINTAAKEPIKSTNNLDSTHE
jgi:hypothetical protein